MILVASLFPYRLCFISFAFPLFRVRDLAHWRSIFPPFFFPFLDLELRVLVDV